MKDTIVLYPAPGMGHVVSMVELGKLILRRHYNPNFSINILITTGLFDTPSSNSYLQGISQTNPSITFHRFPLLSVDTSLTRSRAAVAFEFIRLNASNVRHFLQQISETSTIRVLVIDFFCTSALPIAADLGIPTYYFFTSGAAALAAYLYFPTIDKQTTGSFKDLVSTELHVPGLPPFRATHMPEPVLDRDDPAYQDVLYFSLHLPKSKGIIVNTFEELEPIAIKPIADGLCVPDAPTPPIYHIGPLIAEAENRASTADETDVSNTTQHECLSWLDLQPSRSVVFLCFGSRGSFSVEQVKEIADGLERSGQRFLWVVRNPPVDDKSKQIQALADFDINRLMPEGFLERTKERGMVVESWAPQVAVLSHESVGGFVTHCGWNSVLEAVVAGVPMVAWPLYAEQHLNKAALVEDMKMAIPVKQKTEEDGFVSGAELERGVRELMDSESGRELSERSLKMRERASAAWGELGSSTTALAYLAQLWSETKVQVLD